jgi:hypothetical protein
MPTISPAGVVTAIAGLLLLQVPPGMALAQEIVEPVHRLAGPVIGPGAVLIIIAIVTNPVLAV